MANNKNQNKVTKNNLNYDVLATLDEKQQRQVLAALERREKGEVIGEGQRKALAAYKAALANYKPSSGSGSGGGSSSGGGGASKFWMSGGKTLDIDQIIDDPARLEQALNAAGIPGATLQEKLKNAMLAYTFAGLEQFRNNITMNWDAVISNPALQNVGMYAGKNALRSIIGETIEYLSDGQGDKLRNIWSQRFSMVPSWDFGKYPWPEDIYSALKDPNHPTFWSTELLSSPEINYKDPSRPLFDPTENPSSLLQLTGGGRGERAFYASLSPEELMLNILPLYNAYYNRPAGSEAPFSGFTFGALGKTTPGATPLDNNYLPPFWDHPIRSPLWQLALQEDPGSNRFGVEQPAWAKNLYGAGIDAIPMANQLYARWQVYGYPGDPTQNGVITDYGGPLGKFVQFVPLTGQGGASFSGSMGSQFNDWINDTIPPNWLAGPVSNYTSWSQVPIDLLKEWWPAWGVLGYLGSAAALGHPEYYWMYPWAAPFSPDKVGQDAINRFIELVGMGMA